MRDLVSRRKLYSKVFDQSFSPCGRFLAVADSNGTISVFDLDIVLSQRQILSENDSDSGDFRNPSFQVFHPAKEEKCGGCSVGMFALDSSETHLICADSQGTLFFYRWTDLEEKEQSAKPVSSVQGTCGGTEGGPAEINSLKVSKEGRFLATGGAGDNELKIWNLENGKLETSLSGHTDYIHELALQTENDICTASEDGTVRFWDLRSGSCSHMICPSSTECARPNSGRWIGCVAVDKDWMVCGGGPSLGLWHMGSMSLAKVLNAGELEAHAAIFYEDKIITGGSRPKLFHWNFRGDLLAEVPVSPLSVYSIKANNSEQYKVLTASGASSKVDVFINPGYKAFSLETFPTT